MDYNLRAASATTVDGPMSYDISMDMPYGAMPLGMLEAKFEETDIGPDEHVYDDFVRNEIRDRTPDKNLMEYQEPRRDTSSGRLQLQYNGHRGNVDIDPYQPERFDGFMGDEDRDPRGSQVDPDMKQMVRQEKARMRFIRFSADGNDSVTGGGRSQPQLMADQQTLFRTVRDRLKVFDRQLDGRRNPLRREYDNKSRIPKSIVVQSYGDAITDRGLNPTRRANIICKSIINTRKFRDENHDALLNVARYTQVRRRGKLTNTQARIMDTGATFAAESSTIQFKAAGLLMADLVRSKAAIYSSAAAGNIDFAASRATVAAKTAPMCRDLGAILGSIAQDAEFASSCKTLTGKTAARLTRPHNAAVTVLNHSIPAHHLLNAEIIYRSVKPGADTRKLADKIITDATRVTAEDINVAAKSAKLQTVSGMKLQFISDGKYSESTNVINYRVAVHKNGDKRVGMTSADGRETESTITQDRKNDHTNYRSITTEDQVADMRYGGNASIERHGRGIGKKYLNRYIDRETDSSVDFTK